MAIDEIDPELCNGCGVCVNSCPMDVIRMDGKSRKAIIKYPEDCMLCGWCLDDCLQNAIHISRGYHRLLMLSWG
ncbi:Ferredoxin-type protein NapF [subsurface metagenome]